MIISKILDISVEIDGKTYLVAENTVETQEKLAEINRRMVGKKKQYELWLEALKVFLSDNAVKELFPRGKGENVDRMENIYCGVAYAFGENGRQLEKEREKATINENMAELDRIGEKLKPINATLEAMKQQ